MRQTEHIGDQAVVLIEAHHRLLDHGRSEQIARRLQRLGMAEIDEHDMATGEQFGVGTEHGMYRGHPAALRVQGQQPAAQRRFQRTEVEDHTGRSTQGEFAQHGVGTTERRRHDDEVVTEIVVLPVGKRQRAFRRTRGVGHFDRETLRQQELGEPTAELARAADHQGTPAAALPLSRDARPLLRRKRTADQEPHQLFGDRGRHAMLGGGGARTEDHLPFAPVVACRMPGAALGARDLATGALAIGDEFDEPIVEVVEVAAEFVEAGHTMERPAAWVLRV